MQQLNAENEGTLYDTVIIGGGITGLTAGYMLRDKNILLLEEDERFGGRVLSEKVHEATNNIGTQFFTVEDSSFVRLIKELGVSWVLQSALEASSGCWQSFLADKFRVIWGQNGMTLIRG